MDANEEGVSGQPALKELLVSASEGLTLVSTSLTIPPMHGKFGRDHSVSPHIGIRSERPLGKACEPHEISVSLDVQKMVVLIAISR